MTLYEYEHHSASNDLKESFKQVNEYASVPANARSEGRSSKHVSGFVDVGVKDAGTNITPMIWLFFDLAYVPFVIIKLLGLQAWFVNTTAGVTGIERGSL
jgi:sterol 24-C-methyltransferase